MTHSQAACLTRDSLVAAYWQACRDGDAWTAATVWAVMRARNIRP